MAIVGFFLFRISMPLSDGIDNPRAEKWGVGGTLTVNRCAVDGWGKGDPWWCHGTFVSSDGTLRISGVRYGSSFDEDPRAAGERLDLDARVAGPGSSEAWPSGNEWQPALIVGIVCLVLTGMVFLWWVSPDDSAAPASPSPPVGRRGRTRSVRRWGVRVAGAAGGEAIAGRGVPAGSRPSPGVVQQPSTATDHTRPDPEPSEGAG